MTTSRIGRDLNLNRHKLCCQVKYGTQSHNRGVHAQGFVGDDSSVCGACFISHPAFATG